MKLVDFENVTPATHQIACLVDHARFAKLHQLDSLGQRQFFLPLVTAGARSVGSSFDGEITLPFSDTNAHRAGGGGADIPLRNPVVSESLRLELTGNQKLTFYFLCHKDRKSTRLNSSHAN